MTLLVAILTLAAPPAAGAPPGPAAVDGVEAIEHVPLPPVSGRLGLRVRALESLVVIEAPGAVAEVARAARRAPRAICPGLTQTPGEVRLGCRSKRIVARLVARPGGALLEISETRGLPWDGEDGPPLLPFDPLALGLGEACPGSTPAGRAECLLARGDREAARAALAEVPEGPTRGLAALRLGDLALAAGDARGAATQWARAQGQPWERAAAVRLCELSWACLTAPRAEALYAGAGLPPPLARELALRRARVLAFQGQPLEALRALAADGATAGGCALAPALCQRVALAALRQPGGAGLEALALWLELPRHDRGGPGAEAEVAAAAIAEREGAPSFAANLLAAAAGRVPPWALGEHLLRTAELYVAGGDRVRAGVVLEFARSRAGRKELSGARWAAVTRSVRGRRARPAPDAPASPPAAADGAALLAAADRAAQAARALAEGGHP